jgi:hydroxypyruvate isomerase
MTANEATNWKMRFAPHIGLFSPDTPMFANSVGSLDPVAHIDFIASHGFAGIEDNALLLRSPEDHDRIGEALVRHGMEMGCFAFDPGHWTESLFARTDSDTQAHLASELATAAEAAARTGGRCITVLSGRDPMVPLAIQLQAMAENLRRLVPMAEKAGLTLLIEPLSQWDFPGMLINDMHDAYAVVRSVNSPAVRLLFDVFHVQAMNGDLIRNLDRTYDVVGMVQIADCPRRSEPGTGEINFVNFLRHLQAKGYDRLVELEFAVTGEGIDGENAALAMIRDLNERL